MKLGRGHTVNLAAIFNQIDRMGVGAIPVVVLMSAIVGAIVAQQGAYQLSRQSATDMDPLVAAAARNQQGVKINQANADRVSGGSGGDTGS